MITAPRRKDTGSCGRSCARATVSAGPSWLSLSSRGSRSTSARRRRSCSSGSTRRAPPGLRGRPGTPPGRPCPGKRTGLRAGRAPRRTPGPVEMSPERLNLLVAVAVAVRCANSLVPAGAARSSSRTPESSPAATRESRPAGWPSRPARTRATRAPLDAGVSNARSWMQSHDGHPRTPVAGAMSTAAAGRRARRPGRWCGHGHQASRFMGKVGPSLDRVDLDP
jgi:hypothetical protein